MAVESFLERYRRHVEEVGNVCGTAQKNVCTCVFVYVYILCVHQMHMCVCVCAFVSACAHVHTDICVLVCSSQDFISDQFTYDLPLLSPLVTTPCDCQPVAVALSPYNFGEAVVIMETGEMRRWSGEK